MPIKLLLKFKSEEPIPSSSLNPKVIHGLFFSTFTKEDGELFHKPPLKPFSIYYTPWFTTKNREISSFSIEINLLNNNLFPVMSRNFFLKKEKPMSINANSVYLQSIKPLKITTYENILNSAREEKDLILDFVTPTCFKKGKYDFILPDIKLIFKNLINRWNKFSPIKISRELLSWISEHIIISGCWIKTKKLEITSSIKLTGFIGRVFMYATESNTEKLKSVYSLLKFAEFAGVGRKTTMGFGKVKFVKKSEEE